MLRGLVLRMKKFCFFFQNICEDNFSRILNSVPHNNIIFVGASNSLAPALTLDRQTMYECRLNLRTQYFSVHAFPYSLNS